MMYTLGIRNVLTLLHIDDDHALELPKEGRYLWLASKIQYNTPCNKEDRRNADGKMDALYLIRPLLELMQEMFPKAWIPPLTLTVDESLWAFKGMTFLKRYMPDKPHKYGFLEYALCTLNGYFLCIIVHHVPGAKKRKQRGLNEHNLDAESLLHLKLQKRYGVQGAIVMRLVSMLDYEGHHIVGDNAFSSVQLAVDLKRGDGHNLLEIKKCDYTGTQKMQVRRKDPSKTGKPLAFVEYRNLPYKWDGTKKYDHTWYCDNKKSISVIRYNDNKKVNLISTRWHGSTKNEAKRTRKGKRTLVRMPHMAKNYSNDKIGVDVGDQGLRAGALLPTIPNVMVGIENGECMLLNRISIKRVCVGLICTTFEEVMKTNT